MSGLSKAERELLPVDVTSLQLTREESWAFVLMLQRIRAGSLRGRELAHDADESTLMRRACLKVAAAFAQVGIAAP
jgi:hypothetical protein